MKRKKLDKLFHYGIIILLVILIINVYSAFNINKLIDAQKAEHEEASKPAEIALLTLTTSCTDCSKIDPIVEAVKGLNVKIIKELAVEEGSNSAKELTDQYSITKLPAVIVKGEIDKLTLQGFDKVDDALVFNNAPAPYKDVSSGKIVGKVNTILINDKTCKDCADLSIVVDNLKKGGIIISGEKVFEAANAKELISKHGITKLPALLLSEDIETYPISANLEQGGILKKEGYYIVESSPPYIDVKTGKKRGELALTMVNDNKCSECFSASLIKDYLDLMGLSFSDVKTIDINSVEGNKMKQSYKLDKIPVVVLSGDLVAYEGLDLFWKQLGTIESDGSYIFRNYKQLGQDVKIKDLSSGKVSDLLATQ